MLAFTGVDRAFRRWGRRFGWGPVTRLGIRAFECDRIRVGIDQFGMLSEIHGGDVGTELDRDAVGIEGRITVTRRMPAARHEIR